MWQIQIAYLVQPTSQNKRNEIKGSHYVSDWVVVGSSDSIRNPVTTAEESEEAAVD